MENTTIQSQLALWVCFNINSSAVKTLWFGKAPNGHDIIACKWHESDHVYAYSYKGVIDTFMFWFMKTNSVGQAMAFTKCRTGVVERYLSDMNDGAECAYNAIIEYMVPADTFGSHDITYAYLEPRNVICELEQAGVLERETTPYLEAWRMASRTI